MYDQLAVIAPIMLSVTAATPVLKGRLADTDVRWDVISKSVDCRRPIEIPGEIPDDESELYRNKDLSGDGIRKISKSRYDSVSSFLFKCWNESPDKENYFVKQYNDIECEKDTDIEARLIAGGVDKVLANHLAHLFIRDPLVIFEGNIEIDDDTHTDHFENIQSTNWQTVRWKPPPPRNHPNDPHIGWRTEFRPMEVQLTDFENAAYTVFTILLNRVILAFDLNLYIPMSKVDENMKRAHKRNSIHKEKFWFRKHMAPVDESNPGDPICGCGGDDEDNTTKEQTKDRVVKDDEYEEMTIAEIMLGKGTYYPGLIPLVYAYLEHINCSPEILKKVTSYLVYIQKKVTGETVTTATWMRTFIRKHPDYKKDSVVSESIAYDLMIACKEIGEGTRPCPEILGDEMIEPIKPERAYDVALSGNKLENTERLRLINEYKDRMSFRQRQRINSMLGADSDVEFDDDI